MCFRKDYETHITLTVKMYCSLDGQEPENNIVLNTRHETCLRINTRDQLIDRLVLIITVSDHAINYKQTNDANNYWLVHFFGLVLLIKNADRMLVSKNKTKNLLGRKS